MPSTMTGAQPSFQGILEAVMLQALVLWRIRSSDEGSCWIQNILAGKICFANSPYTQ